MTARRRYGFLLVVAPAMFAVPAMAQSAGPVGGDPFANGTLSSINSGEVSTTVATASGRIEAGQELADVVGHGVLLLLCLLLCLRLRLRL